MIAARDRAGRRTVGRPSRPTADLPRPSSAPISDAGLFQVPLDKLRHVPPQRC